MKRQNIESFGNGKYRTTSKFSDTSKRSSHLGDIYGIHQNSIIVVEHDYKS